MESPMPEITCPSCHAPITPADIFCSRCGTKLNESPIPISAGRKVYIYLFSFFLAPLGLGYAYKYWKQGTQEARKVSITIIVLTIVAFFIMIFATSAFTQWELSYLNIQ